MSTRHQNSLQVAARDTCCTFCIDNTSICVISRSQYMHINWLSYEEVKEGVAAAQLTAAELETTRQDGNSTFLSVKHLDNFDEKSETTVQRWHLHL